MNAVGDGVILKQVAGSSRKRMNAALCIAILGADNVRALGARGPEKDFVKVLDFGNLQEVARSRQERAKTDSAGNGPGHTSLRAASRNRRAQRHLFTGCDGFRDADGEASFLSATTAVGMGVSAYHQFPSNRFRMVMRCRPAHGPPLVESTLEITPESASPK